MRPRQDPNAAGIRPRWPAHVTVVFPFVPPGEIDEPVLGRLSAAVATVPRSRTTFDAEAAVLQMLPFEAEITTAELWCGTDDPGSWSQVRAFPLG